MAKRTRRQNMKKRKDKVVGRNIAKQKPKNKPIDLMQLPLFKFFDTEPNKSYWYGLLPEVIRIQGAWIDEHSQLITLPAEIKPYIQNMVSVYKTALLVAGNDRAYFALYSLRAVLERVAMAWTLHSTSTVSITDILAQLRSSDTGTRKLATQYFMRFAEDNDDEFKILYDMVSQYFAHASRMDGVALGNTSDKDRMLQMRAKSLPLLLLFDTGKRIAVLIESLLKDQGIPYKSAVGGRVSEGFNFDLNKYVRICTYVNCEKHSLKKGVQMRTLFNVKEIEGKVGVNTIYRGGMELIRSGDPAHRPDPKDIASFAWYAIGKGHDDKVRVKCEEEAKQGELYRLSWPKSLELESPGLAIMASHSQEQGFPFFDYVDEFLSVIEKHEESKTQQKKAE